MTIRLTIIMLLLVPSAGLAQLAAVPSSRVSSAISGVKPGTTLRVSTGANGHTTGKLVGIEGAALSLTFERTPVLVPLSAIDSLWIQKTRTGRSVLIGSVISAALFSVLICQPSCEESGVVYPGLLITWIPGALIGAMIGDKIVRWDRQIP